MRTHTSTRVLILSGVSGTGKSTLALELIRQWSKEHSSRIEFLEGDDLHSQDAKEKMAHGVPLEDRYRKSWIERLVNQAQQTISTKRPSLLVITCSALKKWIREELRRIKPGFVQFAWLHADQKLALATIQSRVSKRLSLGEHWYPPELIPSQFQAAELPSSEEQDVLWLNCIEQISTNVAALLSVFKNGSISHLQIRSTHRSAISPA